MWIGWHDANGQMGKLQRTLPSYDLEPERGQCIVLVRTAIGKQST